MVDASNSNQLEPIYDTTILTDPAFRVTDRAQILAALEGARSMDSSVALYLGRNPGEFFHTTVVGIFPDKGIFSFEASPQDRARAIQSSASTVVSLTGGVKVQFDVNRIVEATMGKDKVLAAKIPSVLVRQQRRNAFRLRLDRPLRCQLGRPIAGQSQLNVSDISVGGLGVVNLSPNLVPPDNKPIPIRLILPDVGDLEAEIKFVKQVTKVQEGGVQAWLAGYVFVDPTPAQETLIQRFISRTIAAQRRNR